MTREGEKDSMKTFLGWNRNRWLAHGVLLVTSVLWCYVTFFFLAPDVGLVRGLAIGLGYLALVQLALTLLIGPWQMLRRRKRNPVNIDLRRDIGIWTAITGTLHVIYGFQAHLGGRLWLFFFREGSYRPLINPFGASNYLGLAATILLIFLFLLSNEISLRWLMGKKWKLFQRSNYFLFGLVVLHTFGYQFVIKRFWVMTVLTLVLSGIVVYLQVRGYQYFRQRWPGRGESREPA